MRKPRINPVIVKTEAERQKFVDLCWEGFREVARAQRRKNEKGAAKRAARGGQMK